MDQAHLILFQIYVSYFLSAGIFLFGMRISNSEIQVIIIIISLSGKKQNRAI